MVIDADTKGDQMGKKGFFIKDLKKNEKTQNRKIQLSI